MITSSGWDHVERALAWRHLEFMPLSEQWRNDSDDEGERLVEACEQFLNKKLLALVRQDVAEIREGNAAENNKRAKATARA